MFSFLINPLFFFFFFSGFLSSFVFDFLSLSFCFFLGLLSFDYIRTAVYSIEYVFHLSLPIFGFPVFLLPDPSSLFFEFFLV